MTDSVSKQRKPLSKYRAFVVVLSTLPILSITTTAGIYVYLTCYYKRPIATQSITLGQTVIKQDPKLTSNSYYIGSSSYKGEVSSKSKKVKDTDAGKLYEISNPSAGVSYITAIDGSADISKLKVNDTWHLQQIGDDPMWLPAGCAQKPSWLLQNRYIVVDDGDYDGIQAVHYYAVYDTRTQRFDEFGGSYVTDTQAHEKILATDVEDGKLVFYIDLQDPSGIFSASSNFKHAKANKEPYIIRRVINVADLTYDDYRVPYTQPSFDVYYTKIDKSTLDLMITTDGQSTILTGAIKPNQLVTLVKVDPTQASQVTDAQKVEEKQQATYQDAIEAYLKTNVPEYATTLNNPDYQNFSVYFDDTSGDKAYTRLPMGGLGSSTIPLVYDTINHSVDMSAIPTSLSDWNNTSTFTLGIFKS